MNVRINGGGQVPQFDRSKKPAGGEKTEQNASSPAGSRSGDAVEFSGGVRALSGLSSLPEVRQDRVDSIKAQIEAGGYLSDGKIDEAVDRMIDSM